MKSKLPSWPRTSPNTKFCFIGKLPARLICNDFKSRLLRRAFIKITLSHCVGIRAADGWQTYLLFFLKSLYAIFYCFILTFSFFDINFGTKSWWLCLGSIAASQTSKPTYLLKLLFSIFLLFYMAFFFEIWHQKHDHSKKYSKNETWNYELSVEKFIDYKNKSGRFLKLKKFKWNW